MQFSRKENFILLIHHTYGRPRREKQNNAIQKEDPRGYEKTQKEKQRFGLLCELKSF